MVLSPEALPAARLGLGACVRIALVILFPQVKSGVPYFKYIHQEITMSVPINALTDKFAVAPQLAPEDLQAVADAGFKSVIINRTDLEGGPDQPLSSEVMAAARVAGLRSEERRVGKVGVRTGRIRWSR